MKEIGSWLEYTKEFFDSNNELLEGGDVFLSGRAALRHTIATLGIREIYLPNYYCPDVEEYLTQDPNLTIREYLVDESFDMDQTTFEIPSSQSKSTALVVVDFFGKRDKSFDAIRAACAERGVVLIVDRTHSLLNSYARSGDIAFASIRKSLVHLPGALLYGVKHEDVRRALDLEKPLQSLEKKRHYLTEHDVVLKEAFLSEMRELEASLAAYEAYPHAIDASVLMTIIQSANLTKMARAHTQNYAALFEQLSEVARDTVLPLIYAPGEVPAYLIMHCTNESERDELKKYLIAESIYPPIHWQNGTPLSKRVLSIPIDHRYTQDDMSRVAASITAFYDSYHG
jgi:hypothetical protein